MHMINKIKQITLMTFDNSYQNALKDSVLVQTKNILYVYKINL